MNVLAKAWSSFWPPMVVVLGALLLWQVVVAVFGIPVYLLPTPIEVVESFLEQPGRLLAATCERFELLLGQIDAAGLPLRRAVDLVELTVADRAASVQR